MEFLDARFPGLMRLVVIGPSEAGKSSFLYKLILNGEQFLAKPFHKVYFFYQNDQPIYDQLRLILGTRIEFLEGIPNDSVMERIIREESNSETPCLIALDDFSMLLGKEVVNLFTRVSHHHQMHVCLLMHNLYNRSPYTREITQSANALCLFKNPRDMSFSTVLGKQLMPQKSHVFASIYRDATLPAFGYLFISFHQGTNESLRYLSNINQDEWPIRVFVPEI